jgi:hypothetical protein
LIVFTDEEQSLVKFATKAYSSLIKGKVHAGHDVPEEIFDFQAGTKKSAKRERTKTERLLASEQQENELSPKKKKKQNSKSEAIQQKGTSTEHQDCESISTKLPKTIIQTVSQKSVRGARK